MTARGGASHSGFHKLDEVVRHEGRFLTVATGRFETPAGEIIERDIIHHPGAVAVVPVLGDAVVMVRQYRAALDDDLLEIPAGKRDVEGEDPATTARRELIEEIGYSAGRLTPLAAFYLTPGFCDEYLHVFLGQDLTGRSRDLQGVEEQHMTIEEVPLASVPGLIADGSLRDSKSIIGCLLALRHLGL